MMKMDRELQHKLLGILRDCYPVRDHKNVFEGTHDGSDDEMVIAANLVYLEEHGLVDSGIGWGLNGTLLYKGSKITAAGLDFLEEDGGLSAILGTVTVKLHADTIRDLLSEKIDALDLPAEEKSKLKQHLSTISTEALKAVTKELVQAGLSHLPNALGWLQKLLGP